jgi:hypothetical protein
MAGCPQEDTSATADGASPISDGGSDGSSDGGVITALELCARPVQLADTSRPTAVVGDGTPASCTEAALTAALSQGGVITFRCGAAPLTLRVTSERVISKDTVLDGGGTITLSGGGQNRILKIASTFDQATPRVTIQNLGFSDGRVSGTKPAGDTTLGGAAIYRMGGSLTVINSRFENNRGADSGQDQAGGAIFSLGVGETVIVGSVFSGNSCSNGGALGNLGNPFTLVNSTLVNNRATGSGGNPGNGGNGGAITVDGQGKSVSLCGAVLNGNQARAFGGGFFRVAYQREPTTIDRSVIDGNTIPPAAQSMAGGLYLQNTTANITSTSIVRNSANSAGGLYVGPSAILNLTNVTVSENTAKDSLGGGMAVDGSVTGRIWNCTFAGNRAPDTDSFGDAIAGGGSGLVLENTIIAYSVAGNGYNPISCTRPLGAAGTNVQWPIARSGGGSDSPSALCAAGILTEDPRLLPLGDATAGFPLPAHRVLEGSPACRRGSGCPPKDQLGNTRGSPCTLGAVETCIVIE